MKRQVKLIQKKQLEELLNYGAEVSMRLLVVLLSMAENEVQSDSPALQSAYGDYLTCGYSQAAELHESRR